MRSTEESQLAYGEKKTPVFMESACVLGAATDLIREKTGRTLVKLNDLCFKLSRKPCV